VPGRERSTHEWRLNPWVTTFTRPDMRETLASRRPKPAGGATLPQQINPHSIVGGSIVRPITNLPCRLRKGAVAMSAAALFLLLIAASAVASPAHAASLSMARVAAIHVGQGSSAPPPPTDGGCTVNGANALEVCLEIYGGGNNVDPIVGSGTNNSSNTVNMHVEITGPGGTWNSNETNLKPSDTDTLTECPFGCTLASGTYEAIFWEYSGGSYHNEAQNYEVIS
jgi:hypothetical protein